MNYLDLYGDYLKEKSNYPSPQVSRDFEPSSLLKDSKKVEGFRDHLQRVKPSKSPGVDLDVSYPTESLSFQNKPIVTSPVSGKVVFSGGKDGTVTVQDQSGYYHKMLHMKRVGPVEFVKAGDAVQMGDPVGLLGNTNTNRDHLHYSISEDNSVYFDPYTLRYDTETGKVINSSVNLEKSWSLEKDKKEIERLEKFLKDPDNSKTIRYDDVNAPPTGNVA